MLNLINRIKYETNVLKRKYIQKENITSKEIETIEYYIQKVEEEIYRNGTNDIFMEYLEISKLIQTVYDDNQNMESDFQQLQKDVKEYDWLVVEDEKEIEPNLYRTIIIEDENIIVNFTNMNFDPCVSGGSIIHFTEIQKMDYKEFYQKMDEIYYYNAVPI